MISYYSIFIILAFISNIIVVLTLYKKTSFQKNEVIGALVYENVGIVIGAKLITYLENYKFQKEFAFLRLGLSSYGGILGAIILLILFAFQYKKRLKEIIILFMPSVPLMYGIGKFGCFLAGCCYGISYEGVGHIIYHNSSVAPNNVPLFPVQIIETFCFLGIFLYIMKRYKKEKRNYDTIGILFLLCSTFKFLLDFFRESHKNVILSTNQILSLAFLILGFLFLMLDKNRKKGQ